MRCRSGYARSHPVFQRAEQVIASIQKKIRERGGPTNPELLQEKYPAAVWHLLDALKRFDSLDPRRVIEITFEVARLGESLSRSHQDAEKTSSPARCRRPLRLGFSFQVFLLHSRSCRSSGCLRQATKQRPLACIQHFSGFLRASCMPDSSASLSSEAPA